MAWTIKKGDEDGRSQQKQTLEQTKEHRFVSGPSTRWPRGPPEVKFQGSVQGWSQGSSAVASALTSHLLILCFFSVSWFIFFQAFWLECRKLIDSNVFSHWAFLA